eukprot:COSAG04_NODE_15588_length_527_cov_0.871495_1_plen_47_part_10
MHDGVSNLLFRPLLLLGRPSNARTWWPDGSGREKNTMALHLRPTATP